MGLIRKERCSKFIKLDQTIFQSKVASNPLDQTKHEHRCSEKILTNYLGLKNNIMKRGEKIKRKKVPLLDATSGFGAF